MLPMIWPDVSVIVPVYQDKASLARCLDHLLAQDYGGRAKIIVVDNAITFSLEHFAERYPTIEFLWEPMPGSYHARNKGLTAADTPVLAFTDADCTPEPSWLREGVKALLQDDGIGLVGGRVAIRPRAADTPTVAELFEMIVAFPQKTYVEREHFAATANMFTRRVLFDLVGPFNGALKSGGDADWGTRVAAAGYRLVYADDAVVGHPARATNAEILAKLRRTVGGERDRHPEWHHCLRFVLRYLVPPRKRLMAALTFEDAMLSPHQRVAVMGYCVLVNWACAAHRLRLQLSGAASDRQ